MKFEIELDGHDWNLIYDDQRTWIESHHEGKLCLATHKCPLDHFGCDCDPEELFDRQRIIDVILDRFEDS